ncbi:hypothetical protein HN51_068348 [Arachis hypogaea]
MSLEYLLKERNVEMHNAMLSSGIFPRRRADLKIFQQPTPLPGDLLSGGSLLASPSPSAIEAARFLSERMGSCSGVVEGTCQWNVRSRDDWVQRSGVGLQEQADLWSVGAILYQLITGKPLFDGNSQLQILQYNAKLYLESFAVE